ncbi:hypothetical protein AB1N83_011725, partial [Pleurotus pulmonarius]
ILLISCFLCLSTLTTEGQHLYPPGDVRLRLGLNAYAPQIRYHPPFTYVQHLFLLPYFLCPTRTPLCPPFLARSPLETRRL